MLTYVNPFLKTSNQSKLDHYFKRRKMKKFSVCLFSLLLFVGVAGAVYAAPYTGADITFAGVDNTAKSGRWFTEGDAIWTAWSGEWVEYTAYLDAGNWNIGLNIINHGDLGPYSGWYPQFKMHHTLNSGTILIPASDPEANYGFTNLDISAAGEYTIKYTWLNDKYAPPLDANIQINSAFFDNTETVPNPEPATMLLLGTGLIGLAGFGRKNIQKLTKLYTKKRVKSSNAAVYFSPNLSSEYSIQ